MDEKMVVLIVALTVALMVVTMVALLVDRLDILFAAFSAGTMASSRVVRGLG
jgi:hypothetical protein